MKQVFLTLSLVFYAQILSAQDTIHFHGKVINSFTNEPIPNFEFRTNRLNAKTQIITTDSNGVFSFYNERERWQSLYFYGNSYIRKRLTVYDIQDDNEVDFYVRPKSDTNTTIIPDSTFIHMRVGKALKKIGLRLDDYRLTTLSCARWRWSIEYYTEDGTRVLLYFNPDKVKYPSSKDRSEARVKAQNLKRYFNIEIIRIKIMGKENSAYYYSKKYYDEED